MRQENYLEPDDVRQHLILRNCPQCGKLPGLSIEVHWMWVGCHGLHARARTVQDAIVNWNMEVSRTDSEGLIH